jgi:hypothetical protein
MKIKLRLFHEQDDWFRRKRCLYFLRNKLVALVQDESLQE